MKINAIKLGLASAISASVLWVICSLLVLLMPSMMLSVSGDMMHMQFNNMGWHLTFLGVVKGLVAWSISAGITGWLIGFVYNRLQL